MSMTLEMRAESGVLRVVAMGEFSLDEAQRTFVEILVAVARHKVKQVLFDGRGLAGEPQTIERFYYGEFAANAVAHTSGVSPATHFAYVLEEPVLDPKRFGEIVAANRGMFVKTFDNLKDAVGWLESRRIR